MARRAKWSSVLAVLLGVTAAAVLILAPRFVGEAAAQCVVTRGDPVELDDNGSAVYIALNRLTGLPVVVWVADDENLYLSRFNGTTWSVAEFVDTGGIKPAYSDVDVYHPFPAVALAINSFGVYHLIIVDESHLYHFTDDGTGWSAAQIVTDVIPTNPADPHLSVKADFDQDDALHVAYAIDNGNDASGRGLRYLKLDAAGWSAPLHIASSAHMHMDVSYDGAVHVSYMQAHSPPHADWRNYQGHYRQRTPAGTWLPDEQATDEPAVGTLGPVAIHPTVAGAPNGVVHMVYPVDPPICADASVPFPPQESGHVSHISRTGGVWSTTPLQLFANGIHAAPTEVEVDPAGVIYAFGINWDKRYKVDTGSGFGALDHWDPAHSRWFYHGTVSGPAGAWIAYVASRRMGPIKVVHLHRTGNCGTFCGDGNCGAGEDGCSCLYDCTDFCCIDGAVYLPGDARFDDPCYVCNPSLDRRGWTHDPLAPGCTMDGGVLPDGAAPSDAGPGGDSGSGNGDGGSQVTSTRGGCSCFIGQGLRERAGRTPSLFLLAALLLAVVLTLRRRKRSSGLKRPQ